MCSAIVCEGGGRGEQVSYKTLILGVSLLHGGARGCQMD